jgi:hypothetical protein
MKKLTLCVYTLANLAAGTAALFFNPGFKSFSHMTYCILIVACLVFGPFIPFLFGWRLGAKLPYQRGKTWMLMAVFLITLIVLSPRFPVDEDRFGGYLMFMYGFPLFPLFLFMAMGGFWGSLAGLAFAVGYLYLAAWIMVHNDYMLIREKNRKPEQADEEQLFKIRHEYNDSGTDP